MRGVAQNTVKGTEGINLKRFVLGLQVLMFVLSQVSPKSYVLLSEEGIPFTDLFHLGDNLFLHRPIFCSCLNKFIILCIESHSDMVIVTSWIVFGFGLSENDMINKNDNLGVTLYSEYILSLC